MNNQNLIYDIADTTEESGIEEPLSLGTVKKYLRLEGFSDVEASNITPEPSIGITLAFNETTVQDDRLVGATILTLAREGATHTQALTVGNLKFTFDSETGTISFLTAGNSGGESIAVSFGFMPAIPTTEFTYDDDYITELITDARQAAEQYCGVSIVEHEWTVLFKNEAGDFVFPYGPNQQIVSLKNSNDEDIDSDNYKLRGTMFKFLESPACDKLTAVYTAGYTTVPKGLLRAMKEMIAFWYFHRGDEVEINRTIPQQAYNSMSPFKQSWTWAA